MKDLENLSDIMRKRVASRDKIHLDPGQRAEYVNTLIFYSLDLSHPKDVITNPLYWDILSFCVEFINHWALNLENEQVLITAMKLNNLFYSLHYSLPDDANALGPKKDAHEEIWKARITRVLEALNPELDELSELEKDK